MTTFTHVIARAATPARERGDYAPSTLTFDWIAVLLAALVGSGLYLDGWAHNHGKVDSTFFTPWHAVIYGSMAFTGLFLLQALFRNRLEGHGWSRALPRGYGLSLLGVAIFVVGGVADLVWHELFGFEVNIEALLSPTHLFLAFGGLLIIAGPLRSAGIRRTPAHGWRELGPMVLSAGFILAEFSFFTEFAHPQVNPLAASGSGQSFAGVGLGVASLLIQAGLLTGLMLLLVRRWQLPFGALTLIMTLNAVLVSVLRDQYGFIPAAFASGLIADLLLRALAPSPQRRMRYYLLAFLTPVVYNALYFVSLISFKGTGWSIHLVGGSIVMTGIVGLVLCFLLVPPPSLDPATVTGPD